MLPLMGFGQLSVFAVYAIYLPELFPTSLRSTGTSFCYNFGRIVAATAPFTDRQSRPSAATSRLPHRRHRGQPRAAARHRRAALPAGDEESAAAGGVLRCRN